MKTTTKAIAAKKLAKLNESKTSIAYKVAAELLGISDKKTYMINDNVISTCYTSGSGRFCSNQDHTDSIKNLLSKIGINTTFNNISPRGGLTGNRLTIVTKLK
jgi:hypothetical protein